MPIVLFIGRNQYIVTPPRGSIILEVSKPAHLLAKNTENTTLQCLRVFRIAAAERWSWNPWQTYFNFKKPGFWDPAKPSSYSGSTIPERITWDDQFVGEVKRTFKACKVFVWFPFFWLGTFLVRIGQKRR